jgi:hypothetical protein
MRFGIWRVASQRSSVEEDEGETNIFKSARTYDGILRDYYYGYKVKIMSCFITK